MDAQLTDRLLRWARELPITEPIPVVSSEVGELAMDAWQAARWQKAYRNPSVDEWINMIKDGRFLYCNHPVVVL